MDMPVLLTLLTAVMFGVHSVSGAAPLCDDISHGACRMMQQTKPDLCNDTTLAMSACRRFCGLCPVECYHCTGTVRNYADCNTTKFCAVGEMCMIKQLDATVDDHREFAMTCDTKQHCDGTGLSIPFGRRDIQPRDVSIHCCSDDLCNYPTTPATPLPPPRTDCEKDILFMVDEGSSIRVSITGYNSITVTDALALITNIVKDINVGPNAAHVSLATYSQAAHKQFALNTHHTTQAVVNAIAQIQVQSHYAPANTDDTYAALAFLLHEAMTSPDGDRMFNPDAVVIITDNVSLRHHQALSLAKQLHSSSRDVITIEVGLNHAARNQLATDAAHALSVPNSHALVTDAFKQQVQNLICARHSAD